MNLLEASVIFHTDLDLIYACMGEQGYIFDRNADYQINSNQYWVMEKKFKPIFTPNISISAVQYIAENKEKKKLNQKEGLNEKNVQTFDWNAFSSIPGSFNANLKTKAAFTFIRWEKIEIPQLYKGVIVEITSKEVIVNMGFISSFSLKEIYYDSKIKVGSDIEVYIVSGWTNTTPKLNHMIARRMRAWERIFKSIVNQESLTGKIVGYSEGGYKVDLSGLEAFLHFSQIKLDPGIEVGELIGKTMDFKVINIDYNHYFVSVSHTIVHMKEYSEADVKMAMNPYEGSKYKYHNNFQSGSQFWIESDGEGKICPACGARGEFMCCNYWIDQNA